MANFNKLANNTYQLQNLDVNIGNSILANNALSVNSSGNIVLKDISSLSQIPSIQSTLSSLKTTVNGKEPTQKRTQWNSGDSTYYTKCGYCCFLHAGNEAASSVVKTLASAYRPRYAVTVSGWCLNNSTKGFYPLVGMIMNDGTWNYLTAMNEMGMTTAYYIYNKDQGVNRLSRFNVWLTGAWATNVNGA